MADMKKSVYQRSGVSTKCQFRNLVKSGRYRLADDNASQRDALEAVGQSVGR